MLDPQAVLRGVLDRSLPKPEWTHESTSRDAPLGHWSRDCLFSAEARLGWVEPDLAPLPTA